MLFGSFTFLFYEVISLKLWISSVAYSGSSANRSSPHIQSAQWNCLCILLPVTLSTVYTKIEPCFGKFSSFHCHFERYFIANCGFWVFLKLYYHSSISRSAIFDFLSACFTAKFAVSISILIPIWAWQSLFNLIEANYSFAFHFGYYYFFERSFLRILPSSCATLPFSFVCCRTTLRYHKVLWYLSVIYLCEPT